MQSLARAIKRDNAVIYLNKATQKIEVVWKKGTERKFWKYALRSSQKVND